MYDLDKLSIDDGTNFVRLKYLKIAIHMICSLTCLSCSYVVDLSPPDHLNAPPADERSEDLKGTDQGGDEIPNNTLSPDASSSESNPDALDLDQSINNYGYFDDGSRDAYDLRDGSLSDHRLDGDIEQTLLDMSMDLDDQINPNVLDDSVDHQCRDLGPSVVEICDLIDNDCDGEIDELIPSQDTCMKGLGICARSGELICVQGVYECNAVEVMPANESCNGLDDDCDGTADEGTLNACGECGALPVETCNHVDDDCDGIVDELFPQKGDSCVGGVGECQYMGALRCNLDGTGLNCRPLERDPLPALPQDESCDYLDNDCDALTDEDFDLSTDVLNCGSCSTRCQLSSANRCVQGRCQCGMGGPCGMRAVCIGVGSSASCQYIDTCRDPERICP